MADGFVTSNKTNDVYEPQWSSISFKAIFFDVIFVRRTIRDSETLHNTTICISTYNLFVSYKGTYFAQGKIMSTKMIIKTSISEVSKG